MRELRSSGNRSRRQAITLIEVLGTMSVLLVIAVAGVSMLGSVTKIGLENKHANQVRVDIARLAAKFRNDVDAADMANVNQSGQLLELLIGDDTVRYRIDLESRRIERMTIDSGQQGAPDWFRITANCRPEFSVDDGIATLRLTAKDARHPWIIEVVSP